MIVRKSRNLRCIFAHPDCSQDLEAAGLSECAMSHAHSPRPVRRHSRGHGHAELRRRREDRLQRAVADSGRSTAQRTRPTGYSDPSRATSSAGSSTRSWTALACSSGSWASGEAPTPAARPLRGHHSRSKTAQSTSHARPGSPRPEKKAGDSTPTPLRVPSPLTEMGGENVVLAYLHTLLPAQSKALRHVELGLPELLDPFAATICPGIGKLVERPATRCPGASA